MIKKVAVIALIIVASLSVAGCTVGLPSTSSPTPTPTPAPPVTTPTPIADYSSQYQKIWERSGFIVERPFTKSTNVRGNDVYMGVMRNTSLSQGSSVTVIEELTKSKTEAKQLYDRNIADKTNEGFVYRADWVGHITSGPNVVKYDGVWAGQLGTRQFTIMYYFNPEVNSWELTTQTH
jgi:hypothetical protein